jgi:hypothetical protein
VVSIPAVDPLDPEADHEGTPLPFEGFDAVSDRDFLPLTHHDAFAPDRTLSARVALEDAGL